MRQPREVRVHVLERQVRAPSWRLPRVQRKLVELQFVVCLLRIRWLVELQDVFQLLLLLRAVADQLDACDVQEDG